jgi:hypothetical protein
MLKRDRSYGERTRAIHAGEAPIHDAGKIGRAFGCLQVRILRGFSPRSEYCRSPAMC